MTDVYDLTRFEEGWRDRPYACSQGYPTVGFGFRIGPKLAPVSLYDFTLPKSVGEVWLCEKYMEIVALIDKSYPAIKAALVACCEADKVPYTQCLDSPRAAVVLSMCFQMGVDKVNTFAQTLKFMANKSWSNAAAEMLRSLWAQQTPKRAARHAEQMKTGEWAKEY